MSTDGQEARMGRVAITLFLLVAFILIRGRIFPQEDQMQRLVDGLPHSQLVELDLLLDTRDWPIHSKIVKIKDISTLQYVNTRILKQDGREIVSEPEVVSYGFSPIDAVFVFKDGSRYDAIVTVPDRGECLYITYPIDWFDTEACDDKRYYVWMSRTGTKKIYDVFGDMGWFDPYPLKPK
ncbi:hypothetical protein [Singulisphaera sp. PoT]|uniref:hypothetical protein n=1 Tax=Singulisphaera sp. PoT TaxID=3411797 RepID=UPI003BF54044